MPDDQNRVELDSAQRFLRVDGILREDLRYSPRMGWETAHVHRRGRSDPEGPVSLRLLGEDGEVLFEGHPEARFGTGCAHLEPGEGGGACRILAYLPLAEGTARIVMRYRDKVIWEREVARTPPSVSPIELSQDAESVRLSWEAEGATSFRVLGFLDGASPWPAAGFVDTEIRCFMRLEVRDGETEVQRGVQARGGASDHGPWGQCGPGGA